MTLDELRTKRIGLVLSSGFFGFFAHAGCLRGLEELGVRPHGFSGSSAGAIVAALAAGGMPADEMRGLLIKLTKEDFWDPEPWHRMALHGLRLFRGFHGYLAGERFAALLGSMLPVQTFEELRYPCSITTTNLTEKKRQWHTSGNLAEAVLASCAVPWLFRFKKMGSSLHLDGGFSDKAPVEALARHLRPEVLIVHYLRSSNLRSPGSSFLEKRFSPGRANTLAVTIGRHEHYLAQKRLAELMGIRVIELEPSVPQVSPGRLDLGPAAFEEARRQTVAFFSKAL